MADARRTSSAAATNKPLVRAPARPRHLHAREGAVDLFAVVVGQAVEQRRMAPAHVGERLDDGCVRPRALRPAPTFRARRGSRALWRDAVMAASSDDLPTPAGPHDDQRAAATAGRVDQRALDDRQLTIAADQRVVAAVRRRRARRAADRAGPPPRARARHRARGAACGPIARTGAARRDGRRSLRGDA